MKLLIPELIATFALVLMLAREVFSKNPKPFGFPWRLAPAVLALTIFSLFFYLGDTLKGFHDTFVVDPYACFFKGFFAATVIVIIRMSREFFREQKVKATEFLLILWCSLIGLFFLVSATDLLLMFVSLETFTLSLYVLAAYLKRDLLSIEAGLKYLIMGSLASAFLIFGIGLIYVATGATEFGLIRQAFEASPNSPLLITGLLLILSGLGFKVASVPFQLWVPDVYEGAPTPVVAYLSAGSKAAGFAVLTRLLFSVFTPFDSERALIVSALAAMTLIYGNLAALVQTNIKRLLGYSSIGHAGYLLIALAAGKEDGATAILYYLLAYGASVLAIFMVITLCSRALESNQIAAYRGMGKRSPFLAAVLFIAFLSLAGIPPLAGFFGKFLVLLSAVNAHLDGLAFLGALMVAVSLFYYFNLVRVFYFEEPENTTPIALKSSSVWMLLVLVVAILGIGIWQEPFLALARLAAHSLF